MKNKSALIVLLSGAAIFGAGLLILQSSVTNKAEQSIYQAGNFNFPADSMAAGLSMEIPRNIKDNVSCSGIFSVDCHIKEASLNIPSQSKEYMSIKDIVISDIDPYQGKRTVNLNIKAHKVAINDEFMPKEVNSSAIFPLSIQIKTNSIKSYKGDAAVSKLEFKVNSKVADLTASAKYSSMFKDSIILVDKNLSITKNKEVAIAEQRTTGGMTTKIDEMKINIKNKGFNKLIYSIYSNVFDEANTSAQKEEVNLQTVGYARGNKLTNKTFNDEISKRYAPMVEHYRGNNKPDMVDYLILGEHFVISNTGEFQIDAKLNSDFTVEEMQLSEDFGKNPGKYFDISVKEVK